ncbi:binding partner of ACD11 1 isoform X2 [Apium graveolens]|uniref:binding partner of ACD11 1 isoform X2 n=1 Tax=Apium graveolens TaxID=4045 RepID=UPI003D7A8C3D
MSTEGSKDMDSRSYTVEVTSLSPVATEKDVHDFFAFCGKIEHVEIIRAGEYASTAYVSFRYAHALETAVLLSGASILDQPVCITNWGQSEDEFNIWNRSSWKLEDESSETHVPEGNRSVPSAGEAVSLAQDVVKSMVSKGYVLGVGALSKAKSFDESHQVSATATAKVAELSERIGLTDKIYAGVGAVKSVDERYHIYDTTKSAVAATGRTAAAATNTVVNSSYFSKGALWMSDALSRAAKAAADLGNRDGSK